MSDFDEMCKRFVELKESIKNKETELGIIRKKLLRQLDNDSKEQISTKYFTVLKRELVTRRLLKNNVPNDIYEQYATETSSTILEVLPEKKMESRRRRSRSRGKRSPQKKMD